MAEGAERASDPSELAANVDVVITMLPDTPDVDLVLFGERGVADGIRAGPRDRHEHDPADGGSRFAERLAAADVAMLDAWDARRRAGVRSTGRFR